MIIPTAYKGKKIGVFGLARTGLAAVASLQAAGASVYAWDDNEERRAQCPVPAKNLYEMRLSDLDALMLAPGVPLTGKAKHALVSTAERMGVPLISDFDLFEAARADLPPHTLVVITGTNGKSTTTALLVHMLCAAGRHAVAAGNIGLGVMALSPLEPGGVYVFEASSYQLELTRALHADVGVMLNLAPDHLERHGTMASYIAAKERMFHMLREGGACVIGVDDVYSRDMAKRWPKACRISGAFTKAPAAEPAGALAADQADAETVVQRENAPQSVPHAPHVWVDGTRLIERSFGGDVAEDGDVPTPTAQHMGLASALALKGRHNHQNAAAVFAAGRLLGVSPEAIMHGLQSFKGLEHRQQLLGQKGGVTFINDSKATNVDSALRALETYQNIHWIAGGRGKGESYHALRDFAGHVKKLYLIGDAASVMAEEFDGAIPFEMCGTLNTAFASAVHAAESGDVVLLSPACAAFDQFKDFEDRGRAFASLVGAYLSHYSGGVA